MAHQGVKPIYHPKNPTLLAKKFFLAKEDAADLNKALTSDPIDVDTIINILGNRTLTQRLEIVNEYRKLYSESLVDILKDKLSGDLENLIVAMMTPLDQYLAVELHNAVAGLGTDESDLIEVLCTRTNLEIKAIRRAYHQKYQVYLEDDIKDDTSGNFKNLLVALIKTERDEYQKQDPSAATVDANALYNATKEERWNVFSDVLIHRSYAQLRLIFNEFENVSGDSIETAVKNYFSAEVEEGLLAIVQSVRNPAIFFAQKLNKCIAGAGTADTDLIRAVVTRSEIDMGEIKTEYQNLYSSTLKDDIIGDTSGDYQKCLLVMIGEA